MSLNFENEDDIDWGDLSTNIFLTRTEYLLASGWGEDFDLNLANGKSIRWLALEYFTNEKNIASAAAAFPLLEYLRLKGMYKLEEIWDDDAPIPSNSFNNLKRLHLSDMQSLKRMGKSVLSIAKDFFLKVETIVIKRCDEIEHLVMVPNEEEQDKDEDDISTVVTFPKLTKLFLYDVPKLRSMICSRGIESIQFPVLSQLEFEACGNLKWLVSRDDDGDRCQDDDDDSLHLLCHPKVSFGNVQQLRLGKMEIKNFWCDKVPLAFFTRLVELNIGSCKKIRRLFSSSSKIPQNLISLQLLRVYECKEIVKVIEDEEEVLSSSSSCDHTTIQYATPLFPSLQELRLSDLPKLESFCEWRCALELPSLKILGISKCDEMKSFNGGSLVITPVVQRVAVDSQDLEYAGDLNAALHLHLEKAKREQKKKIVEAEGEESKGE